MTAAQSARLRLLLGLALAVVGFVLAPGALRFGTSDGFALRCAGALSAMAGGTALALLTHLRPGGSGTGADPEQQRPVLRVLRAVAVIGVGLAMALGVAGASGDAASTEIAVLAAGAAALGVQLAAIALRDMVLPRERTRSD